MKKITLLLTFFILGFLPTIVFAKMGDIFPGSGGGGGLSLILWLVSIAGVCISYIFLIGNIKESNVRKEKNEKMRKIKLTLPSFAVFSVIAFFISLPFLLWISNYRYDDTHLQDGLIAYVIALALMLFFRR
jgi:hypothetical protein|tara:strand:+ start:90 stop:482 length:393 start_codon:yes stop_codon:yes gene_type:complete